jgi:hypothetical protein
MAAIVVGVTVSANRSAGRTLATGSPASARTRTVGPGGAGSHPVQPANNTGVHHAGAAGLPDNEGAATSAKLAARLAAALRPVLARDSGQLAVGVIDNSTGTEALYHAGRHFHTASIVKADILAALLYQHQQSAMPLSNDEADQAAAMIEHSSDDAATQLWNEAGGSAAVAAANRVLKLRHTIVGQAEYWGLTETTVTDQLQLLTDLTAANSPIDSAGRDYELGLMEDVQAGQRWGVSAAAAGGSTDAIKDGWLPDPRLWVINSVGVVERGGQELLIAVLSDHNPTEAGGISAAAAAAMAAARAITQSG